GNRTAKWALLIHQERKVGQIQLVTPDPLIELSVSSDPPMDRRSNLACIIQTHRTQHLQGEVIYQIHHRIDEIHSLPLTARRNNDSEEGRYLVGSSPAR